MDTCLFFHPAWEGGELPGRCTVLSARKERGQCVSAEEGDERQMRAEGWNE